jgi:hypothetical protein
VSTGRRGRGRLVALVLVLSAALVLVFVGLWRTSPPAPPLKPVAQGAPALAPAAAPDERQSAPAPRFVTPAEAAPPAQKQTLLSVSGMVMADDASTPLSGAFVQIAAAQGTAAVMTGADGRFTASMLANTDSLRVEVQMAGYVRDSFTVPVQPGGAERALELGPIRLLTGDPGERQAMGTRGLTGLGHRPERGDMVITEVRPGTAAADAGIRPGDLVLSIDGRPVSGLGWGARSYLLQGAPGTSVSVEVQTPGERPRTVSLVRRPPPRLRSSG